MTPSPTGNETTNTERRDQILQAAIACFSRKGYHLTTMNDIVAESGMSKGSLYWHYKNKKDILFAVMDWYLNQITEEMLVAAQESPTATDKLKSVFDLFAATVAAEDTLFNVFIDFYAETRHDQEVTQRFRQGIMPYIDYVAQIIQEGIATGEFKPVETRHMAVVFMAASEGLLLYKIILAGDFAWNRTLQLFAETMLAGLRAQTLSGKPVEKTRLET